MSHKRLRPFNFEYRGLQRKGSLAALSLLGGSSNPPRRECLAFDPFLCNTDATVKDATLYTSNFLETVPVKGYPDNCALMRAVCGSIRRPSSGEF